MGFAYLPLFTGDYLRDTRHLSPLRHGVYLLLLIHCWDSKGPVPLDLEEAAGIAGCRTEGDMEALRYILGKYFERTEQGYVQRRMQTEIERSENLSRVRSQVGRKGYEARAKQLPSKSQALASIPIPIPIPKPENLKPTLASLACTEPSDEAARSAPPPAENLSLPLEGQTPQAGAPARARRKARDPLEPVGTGEVVCMFPALGGQVEIRQSFVDELIEAFPAVLVVQEIDRARLWVEANPEKRKKNVRRFLTLWVSRTQERGGSR